MNAKWWIGSYIEVFEPEKASEIESELHVNENFMLIAADNFEEAHRNLLIYSEPSHALSAWKGVEGHWRVIGISCLLPIYESLEDGSELLLKRLVGYTRADLADLVYTKEELLSQVARQD